MSRFENAFFPLTVNNVADLPEADRPDIIIIGSGIGGGVLANDLYDTNLKVGNEKAKKILLLERGGLVFHSHCLNTARSSGDRGRQNDSFFSRFRDTYQFSSPPPPDLWNGGPMYNLGGRSAAWGLFVPRVNNSVLKHQFHPDVYNDLSQTYYDKAERLMLLSLPTTKRVHQNIMDRLNIDSLDKVPDSKAQWQWGRIASEFHDDRNFDFAEGAYSTIDKILEIAMSKRAENRPFEHEKFETVLNANVHKFKFRADKSVEEIEVRIPDQPSTQIKVKEGAQVVLCAGSVNSPAILMRSGKQSDLEGNGGLHLTDHDAYFYENSFRYSDPKDRDEYGSMKLQTYVDIGPGPAPQMALANISIDASSFLSRSKVPDDSLPRFFMVFILQSKLAPNNSMRLDANEQPVITMTRGDQADETQYIRMKDLTRAAMESLKESAKLQFVGSTTEFNLTKIPLGSVAHELGTLPMKSRNDAPANSYCLDENLRFKDEIAKNLYACDLSCFPHSPESNPTLTLAALAIRLSRELLPRGDKKQQVPQDKVKVINHSEGRIQVWLTDYPNRQGEGNEEKLDPGADFTWTRAAGVTQCLFVFKRDPTREGDHFVKDPIPMVVYPAKLNSIQGDRVVAVGPNEEPSL